MTGRHILVVANETLAGEELLAAVRARAGEGVLFTVIAPVNTPREGYVVYENTRRASAGRRLDRTLASFREAGIAADGHVVDHDPLTAVKDALAQERPDEVIVSTHPDAKSGWRRRSLIDEIRKAAGETPVEHVVSDVASRTGVENVLVVANETVLGEPLLDRIRERARENPNAGFLIVCPQSDPTRAEQAGFTEKQAPNFGPRCANRAQDADLHTPPGDGSGDGVVNQEHADEERNHAQRREIQLERGEHVLHLETAPPRRLGAHAVGQKRVQLFGDGGRIRRIIEEQLNG